MYAVILAAGKGTRIYPFSQDRPKPLIRIANKAVLEHNLDQMIGLITQAIIIVGYRKDMIISHLGHTYRGIKLTYLIQQAQQGTAHALLQAKDSISTGGQGTGPHKILVLNGDDLFSRQDMLNVLNYPNCLLVEYKDDPSSFGSVIIENNRIIDIIEKSPVLISNYVSTGLYSFEDGIFDILSSLTPSIRGEYELTDAVKILSHQGRMYAQPVEGYWIPVGYPWHILDATEMVLATSHTLSIKGTISDHVRLNGTIDVGEGSLVGSHSALTGNIIIGKKVTIGKNVFLSGFCAIADGTIIEDNVILHNSVIGESCHICHNSELYDSVLGNRVTLHPHVILHNTNPHLLSSQRTIPLNLNGQNINSHKNKLGSFIADNSTIKHSLAPGNIINGSEHNTSG